jgi:hypothetical protein
MLTHITLKWVGSDKDILTDLRSTFGCNLATAGGCEMLKHIKVGYVDSITRETGDAEQALADFKWSEVFDGDAAKAHKGFNKLWSILALVPSKVAGSTKYWISRVNDFMPYELAMELQRYLGAQLQELQREAATNAQAFARARAAPPPAAHQLY